MRFSTIALIALLFGGCNSDLTVVGPPQNTAYTPSDSAKAHFLIDATDFAVDHLFEIRSPDTIEVFVPDSLVQSYLYPLARLYDERPFNPLLDSLIGIFNLHRYRVQSFSTSVGAETSQVWVKNIKNGTIPTGDPIVDSLISTYGLTVGSILDFGARIGIEFKHRPLNTKALSRSFRGILGVVWASPSGGVYSGSDLFVKRFSDGTLVQFLNGHGDCPSGCFWYDRWSFTVSKDFDVQYLGWDRL